jgi:hypothetical protein
MHRTLVTLAVAALFLAALPLAAQTGTWTAVGSTGVIDESSTGAYAFGTTNLTYNGSTLLTPIIARYNVTNTFGGGFSDTPGWQNFEMGYFDASALVSLRAELYQVDPCNGKQTLLCTVGSVDATVSTCGICQFHPVINFGTNLYYVQVTLTRQSLSVPAPQLFTLRLY